MLVFTDQPSVHIYVGGKYDDQLTGKEKIKSLIKDLTPPILYKKIKKGED